jgi:MFS transporter, DHA1 family, tetracycline resistance protein
MKAHSQAAAIAALTLVLFIDGLGQSILFPLLTQEIANTNSLLFFSGAEPAARNLWYGLLIGTYFFSWFFSAPILGDWSDNVGRKKALIVCLLLAAVGFIVSIIAISYGSLALLLSARLLGGMTSGDQAIAQASVIDICDPAKKSIYLGLMLLPVTLGLALGPMLGSILQDPTICNFFNLKTPFYFALGITLVNIVLLCCFYHETTVIKKKPIRWLKSLTLFQDAFRLRSLRLLSLAYFFSHTGWAMFYIDLPDYAIKQFAISNVGANIMLGLAGLGMGIGLAVLPSLCKRLQHKSVVLVSYCILLFGCVLTVTTHNASLLWLIIMPLAASFGLSVSNLLPFISNSVGEDRQGWVMGIVGAVIAISAGGSALIVGLLTSIDILAPYIFSSLMVISGISCFCYYLISYKR